MNTNYFKEYYLKNKERMRETLNIWKDNNKEHLTEYRREYYRNYNRLKSRRKKVVDKMLAINLCIVEARLNGDWDDVTTFTNIFKKAIEEELKIREKESSNI